MNKSNYLTRKFYFVYLLMIFRYIRSDFVKTFCLVVKSIDIVLPTASNSLFALNQLKYFIHNSFGQIVIRILFLYCKCMSYHQRTLLKKVFMQFLAGPPPIYEYTQGSGTNPCGTPLLIGFRLEKLLSSSFTSTLRT